MKLEDCTKEELMAVIRKAFSDSVSAMFSIKSALSEIESMRTAKNIQEAEKWAKLARDYRNEYYEILKRYGHTKVVDIPSEAIKKADECLKKARQCDRRYESCMRMVKANDRT